MAVRVWKMIGLAGLFGVATTAAVVAARRRRSWTEQDPAELRARLHDRFAHIESHPPYR